MDNNLLETFAARANQREHDRKTAKEFMISGIGKLAFVQPNTATQLEYYEMFAEAKTASAAINMSVSLIYDCCPSLSDTELHNTLGVKDPYDVVRKILTLREIDVLGGKLLEWMGIIGDDITAEKTVKN